VFNQFWEKYTSGTPMDKIFQPGEIYFCDGFDGSYEVVIIKQTSKQAFLFDSVEFWCEDRKYTKLKFFYNVKSTGEKIMRIENLDNREEQIIVGLFRDVEIKTSYNKGDTL
jgi:hypothetical protein